MGGTVYFYNTADKKALVWKSPRFKSFPSLKYLSIKQYYALLLGGTCIVLVYL
ncbi:uncharacterized protein ASPGLDRAFT_53623, partial [Aspergillus glaucus CBS 516.65]